MIQYFKKKIKNKKLSVLIISLSNNFIFESLFLFFLFCNAKWPEIESFLSKKPGQKLED
jgi:hypothetical protein